jgi:hypothetical protein
MECSIKENLAKCSCTYQPCSRKGKCCECITYHVEMQELPACVFPPDIEKTYNRTFLRFAQVVSGKG